MCHDVSTTVLGVDRAYARKPVSAGFPTRYDPNRTAHLQQTGRRLS